ncbi:ATP-binding protein [Candidatus Peregrinibacteria bacterium]|nr:ATP-binding protein [Candidatus Peregrinibacteria bacterium]
MYKKRAGTARLQKLAKTFPIVVVIGARQVGKSTLLRHIFGKKAEYVVFDPLIDIENARKDPELFLDNHRTPIILDEVQYVPGLVSAIKRKVDENRAPGQYLMTGSQQWGILKSMAESLAGRAVFIHLENFSLMEIAEETKKKIWLSRYLENPEKFVSSKLERLKLSSGIYEQLWRGFFPEGQNIPLETVPDFYGSYIQTYIERDVRFFADVSDIQTFRRFVQLVAALSAQEVNYSELGRELGITPQTSKRWLEILKATFQWFEIPAFSRNAIKRLSNKPKGYFVDTGLICNLHAISSPQAIGGHPLWGPLFETAVAAEIRKHSSFLALPPNIYHWRSHGGAEVDILLEKDGRYFPIEVKASTRPTRGDTLGIEFFRKTYPHLNIAPGLIISPAEKKIPLSEKNYALPWDSV